ncbi:hypothetical protein [Halobellus limi]|uniref:LexA-binding, inner membrane-associated hydrolase n=1 Tax=Halobellus limi TaxID=699433 RepID=A0A1H5U0V5_9EURY|nr:hypothetical protein [Halobellus limi]QCC47197.1 hypothetical protein DV707_05635 [Halobellus limi]SEF67907.1 hypothetical protein SAMN04488133_0424 [Halobellus limi]
MQALVHFTVGISIALLIFTRVDLPTPQEFLLMFCSGFWGLVPDGHWLFREFGITGVASTWRAVHQTVYVNVFWFHHFIDSIETGRNNLEAGIALGILLVAVAGYHRYNDWTIS